MPRIVHWGRIKAFKPEHRIDNLFDCSMVLLGNYFQCRQIGMTLINRRTFLSTTWCRSPMVFNLDMGFIHFPTIHDRVFVSSSKTRLQ